MLPKPVGLTVFGRRAIKAKQNNSLSPPKVGQVNGLISAVAALVNHIMHAKAGFVFAAHAVNFVALGGVVVLRPQLTLKTRIHHGLVVYVPPLTVARIQHIGCGAQSVGVIDGYESPVFFL
jgi:hypothetical protein